MIARAKIGFNQFSLCVCFFTNNSTTESFEFSSKELNKTLQNFKPSQLMNGEAILQNAAEMILVMGYSVDRSTSYQDEIKILEDYKNTYHLHDTKYQK